MSISVYTDGACSGNNLPEYKRKAGIGVFFGDNDPRNLSEKFTISPITNSRAELYACIRALQIIGQTSNNITIYTDSQYIVKIMNGQYNAKANLDLITQLQELCEDKNVSFIHVKGHSISHGNIMADKLAVAGAKL